MQAFARGGFGPFSIDIPERLLLRDGRPVALPPKAFDLLAALVEKSGRLLTKEELLQKVWPDTHVEEANLSYTVFALRKALGDTVEGSCYIETVPKSGYRFSATVTCDEGPDAVVAPPLVASATAAGYGLGPGAGASLAPGPAALNPAGLRPDPLRRRAAVWFLVGGCCTVGLLLLLYPRRLDLVPSPIRAQVAPGILLSEASPFALSPDGRQLAFAGSGPDGVVRLWVRSMDANVARPLAGTETQLGGLTPPMFWSPDSRSIAFDASGQLKRIDVGGGAPRTVCMLPDLAVGGSWNSENVILVGNPAGGLTRCPAGGGAAAAVTELDATNGETGHLFPSFLPDGQHFLYLRVSRQAPETSGVYVGSLEQGATRTRPNRLIATGYGAVYVGARSASAGHILFLRDDTVLAQSFVPSRLELRGNPVPLANPVGSYLDGGFFAASQNDVLVFRGPDKEFQLTWFDRAGGKVGVAGPPGRYAGLAISADGARVVMVKAAPGTNVDQDLWMFDVFRATMTRVTFDPQLEESPVWSADGLRLFFSSGGAVGALFEQAISGAATARLILETGAHNTPTSASADARFLLYSAEGLVPFRRDLWVLPLTGAHRSQPLVRREFDQEQGQFSPDGRWVAYVSNESGRSEVLVRPFMTTDGVQPDAAENIVLSTTGGTAPRWRRDGKELFFIAADGAVMSVDITVGAAFRAGTPHGLFNVPRGHGDWAVLPDGSRFLIAVPASQDVSAPFNILWNGLAALKH